MKQSYFVDKQAYDDASEAYRGFNSGYLSSNTSISLR